MSETKITYKGFEQNMTCRDFQYEVGKEYEHNGKASACNSGFHACEYPLDVFNYYAPASSVFAVVEQSGDLSTEANGNSKIASSKISIKARIELPGLIKAAIEYTFSRSKPEGLSATGTRGAASATGARGAASATGARGAASATGDQGAASATGFQGAASATGYQGAASATGDQGAASATGDQGAASATGTRGAASATGYQGAASATGARGAASATGYEGKAMGKNGNALFLVERNDDYEIIAVWAGIVGKKKIKEGVWYMLKGGKPVEVTK